MKKTTIISASLMIGPFLCLYSFVLTDTSTDHGACAPVDPTFAMDIQSRFFTTVTKNQIARAETIFDLVPEYDKSAVLVCNRSTVSTYHEGKCQPKSCSGNDELLNDEQKSYLAGLDYNADFYVSANLIQDDPYYKQPRQDSFIYYFTLVPEKPAKYSPGQDALIEYLQEESADVRSSVDHNRLQPGKIRFLISEAGQVTEVRLISTSGHLNLDRKMVSLIKNLPGRWESAHNAKGEKVVQDLVFSFGVMGC